jgi:hypothetical protein
MIYKTKFLPHRKYNVSSLQQSTFNVTIGNVETDGTLQNLKGLNTGTEEGKNTA